MVVSKEKPTGLKPLKIPHHIGDWMEKFGVNAAELSRATGLDTGMISRWLTSDASPSVPSQEKLALFFGCTRHGLFRHPDEYWMLEMVQGRSKQEIQRLRTIIEAALPPRNKVGD